MGIIDDSKLTGEVASEIIKKTEALMESIENFSHQSDTLESSLGRLQKLYSDFTHIQKMSIRGTWRCILSDLNIVFLLLIIVASGLFEGNGASAEQQQLESIWRSLYENQDDLGQEAMDSTLQEIASDRQRLESMAWRELYEFQNEEVREVMEYTLQNAEARVN